MASKDVIFYPDAPLTKKAAPFRNGCGLAGPQVGVSKRIAVLREPEKQTDICLINPEITESEGHEFLEEGCLSLPQVYAMVPRYTRLRVRGLNQHGRPVEFEAAGLLARIIQHEVDHLNGIVFLDRVDLLTREAKFLEWQEIRSEILATDEEQ
jgi:peptide deformylase